MNPVNLIKYQHQHMEQPRQPCPRCKKLMRPNNIPRHLAGARPCKFVDEIIETGIVVRRDDRESTNVDQIPQNKSTFEIKLEDMNARQHIAEILRQREVIAQLESQLKHYSQENQVICNINNGTINNITNNITIVNIDLGHILDENYHVPSANYNIRDHPDYPRLDIKISAGPYDLNPLCGHSDNTAPLRQIIIDGHEKTEGYTTLALLCQAHYLDSYATKNYCIFATDPRIFGVEIRQEHKWIPHILHGQLCTILTDVVLGIVRNLYSRIGMDSYRINEEDALEKFYDNISTVPYMRKSLTGFYAIMRQCSHYIREYRDEAERRRIRELK